MLRLKMKDLLMKTKTQHLTRLPWVSRFVSLFMLVVIGCGAVIAAPVAADLRSDIASLEAQIRASQAEADRLGREANTLQNELNRLSAEKNTLQGQIDLNQAKYDQLVVDIAETERKIGAQQKVMADAISDLASESQTSPIELLASSNSIGDYIDQQEYSSSIRDQLETSIGMIKKLKTELNQQKKDVENVLAQQKIQRDELAQKENEQAQLVAATRSQEADYQALVGNLQAKKAAAESALAASLSSGNYKIAPAGYVNAGDIVGAVGSTGLSTGPHLHLEVRRGGGVTNPSPFIHTQPIAMPPGYISQSFGNPDPIYRSGYHPGTDYAAGQGTPIYAIDRGNMYRGCSQQLLGTDAYGYVAIVEHTSGVISIYAHMSGGPAACSYNTYY